MSTEHLHLVRNDWERRVQESVARVHFAFDGYGVIVKDERGAWEGNVFDALGTQVRAPTDEVIELLQQAFRGPYVFASGPHDDEHCPFQRGPLPITTVAVGAGEFVLPDMS